MFLESTRTETCSLLVWVASDIGWSCGKIAPLITSHRLTEMTASPSGHTQGQWEAPKPLTHIHNLLRISHSTDGLRVGPHSLSIWDPRIHDFHIAESPGRGPALHSFTLKVEFGFPTGIPDPV